MNGITVWITENCTACGLCVNSCPDLFEMGENIAVPKAADW